MSNNLTKEPGVAPKNSTVDTANASAPVKVADARANVYGLIAENLDTVKIYVCFFDKETAPVAGVDEPVVSYPVSAEGTFGRDPQSYPLTHFAEGCWMSAALAPDGVGDVTVAPVVRLWTKE